VKPKILFKVFLFIIATLYGSTLQAVDLSWWSDDKLLSLTAVPSYDPNTNLLTSANVTLLDYTLGISNAYPVFNFIFVPPSATSLSQNVLKLSNTTANGSMSFSSLKSSTISTFLIIDLYYGTDTVQARRVEGSVLEIPLKQLDVSSKQSASSSSINASSLKAL
jgi:hypothetical protein